MYDLEPTKTKPVTPSTFLAALTVGAMWLVLLHHLVENVT